VQLRDADRVLGDLDPTTVDHDVLVPQRARRVLTVRRGVLTAVTGVRLRIDRLALSCRWIPAVVQPAHQVLLKPTKVASLPTFGVVATGDDDEPGTRTAVNERGQ
jgi:hypothetical protein